MAHQEFGPKLLARIILELEDEARQERPERWEGRRFVTIVKTVKLTQNIKQETRNEK